MIYQGWLPLSNSFLQSLIKVYYGTHGMLLFSNYLSSHPILKWLCVSVDRKGYKEGEGRWEEFLSVLRTLERDWWMGAAR